MAKKLIIFLFILINFSFSQNNDEPLILQNADQLIGKRSDIEDVRYFIGNVKFKHGDVFVNCDTAIQYIKANKADLFGNVIITQTTLTLQAPKMTYNGNTYIAKTNSGVTINDKGTFIAADSGRYSTKNKEVNFKGNVLIDDDSVIINANRIKHFRINENTFAYGNVKIQGKYNNTILYGDTVINLPQLNYSMATSNPFLIQMDTASVQNTRDSLLNEEVNIDTLVISCDTIKSIRKNETEIYRFIDSVRILRNEIASVCNYAYYNKSDEFIKLIENPVLWFDQTQLFGDTISIFMKNNKLNQITSINKTFVVSMTDTSYPERLNQISGEFVEINFNESDISSIKSSGDIKSLYFIFSDGIADGADLGAADELEIFFEDGEAVKLFKISGIAGEILNEERIAGDIRSFYLPSFRYRNDKPSRKDFLILD